MIRLVVFAWEIVKWINKSHRPIHFSESFVSGWGERYCNNVKNNVIFVPQSMRACFSTPPKQNQDCVKEHNRTPFSLTDIVRNPFTFIVLLHNVIADSNKTQSGYEMLSSDHFS